VCYEKAIKVTAMDMKGIETLGAYLRREREARGIKLAAIAKATKIALPLLVALEADHYDALPDKKAIPAYLKSYCRYLFLDEQEARKRFELPPRHCSPEVSEEACLPEIIDDLGTNMTPSVAAPAYVLPPTLVSAEKKPGFFSKYRLFFHQCRRLGRHVCDFQRSPLLFPSPPGQGRKNGRDQSRSPADGISASGPAGQGRKGHRE
jgi:transcriptional regulator with XRE-family HTH domain